MILKSFEEMCDDETICDHYYRTDYGEHKSCVTPSGYSSCEGMWCEESYEAYLDDNNASKKLVKYQNNVKLLNKEELIR
jgi:hypothetical protein